MTAARTRSRLKELRALLQVTQESMAERTGVTAQTIKAVESGRHAPSLETARKIASAYGSSVDALFPATEVSR